MVTTSRKGVPAASSTNPPCGDGDQPGLDGPAASELIRSAPADLPDVAEAYRAHLQHGGKAFASAWAFMRQAQTAIRQGATALEGYVHEAGGPVLIRATSRGAQVVAEYAVIGRVHRDG